MVKKALVVLAEGFEEIEAVTTIDVLRRAGVEVTVAGLSDLEVKGSRGVIVRADKRLEEVQGAADALVLPGGMPGANHLAASGRLKDLIGLMMRERRLIAAICASPAVVLAPLGVLKGKKATSYPGMQESFPRDASYKEDSVVVDGELITSRGPATAMSFALAIVEKLAGKDVREKVAKALLFV